MRHIEAPVHAATGRRATLCHTAIAVMDGDEVVPLDVTVEKRFGVLGDLARMSAFGARVILGGLGHRGLVLGEAQLSPL